MSGIFVGGAGGYFTIASLWAKARRSGQALTTRTAARLFSPSRAIPAQTDLQSKKPTTRSAFYFGGAGGYCPRVQTVTYYSSTNIVYSRFCNALRLLRINKHDPSCEQ